jgi:hypothetical protein
MIALGLLTGTVVARGQADDECRRRFLAEAPAAWAAYRDFAWRLQGTAHTSAETTFHDQGRVVVTDKLVSIKQNRQAALLATRLSSPRQEARVYFANRQYTAELRGRPDRPEAYALGDIQMGADVPLQVVPLKVRTWARFELSPNFGYEGVELCDLLGHPKFALGRVSPQPGAEGLVRVEYAYTEGKNDEVRHTGVLILDPHAAWCVRRVEDESASPEMSRRDVIDYAWSIHTNGFPLIRSGKFMGESTSTGRGRAMWDMRIDYGVTVREDVPDKEFTLTAFGLPEPEGVTWEKPRGSRLWLWLMLAGFAAALLSFGCFRLRRRLGPKPPAAAAPQEAHP